MKKCRSLDAYVARLLKDREKEEFKSHLNECESCQLAVSRSKETDNALKKMWKSENYPTVTEKTAKILTSSPLKGSSKSKLKFIYWGVSAAATVAVIILLLFNTDSIKKKSSISIKEPGGTSGIKIVSQKGTLHSRGLKDFSRELSVLKGEYLVFNLRKDRIGLSENSQLRIIPAKNNNSSLSLVKGTMALSVKPRYGKDFLSITAGKYLITVIGTRFSLFYDGVSTLSVSVSEGKVKVVSASGDRKIVSKGFKVKFISHTMSRMVALSTEDKIIIENILRGEIPQPILIATSSKNKTVASKKRISTKGTPLNSIQKRISRVKKSLKLNKIEIKTWILEGKFKRVEKELLKWLSINPHSEYGWWLLGESRRKAGNYKGATLAYNRCTKVGGSGYGNRARYKSAVLYQDYLGNISRAVAILKVYITKPNGVRPLVMEAKLRLAKGLLSLGKKRRGQKLLSEIINNNKETLYGNRAKKMLEKSKK